MRTFYLSNADVKETMDLLRIVIDARRIAAIAGTNAITITDTAERVDAAGRLISMIDKARPEVHDRRRVARGKPERGFSEYGLQLASPGSAGINGVADVNKPGLTLEDLQNLTASQVFMTGVPGLYYRLMKQDQHDARARESPAPHPRSASPRRPSSANACRCPSRRSPPSRPAA